MPNKLNETHPEVKPEKENSATKSDSGDTYLENGFMVFTKAYHLRRGFCCGNACRHCPYKEQPRLRTE